MSVKNGKDYLYLVWKDPNTRKQFTVGQLAKNGGYEFSYGLEVHEAINNGFKPLIAFENLNEKYKSTIMFPVFSSRLPDRKRNGIEKILKKYDLEEYDEYKLLKRSGAKLPIDNLVFIDPIIDVNEKKLKRLFYLAGTRYHFGCKGTDCSEAVEIKVGDKLNLYAEPDNKHDPNAVKVFHGNIHIGYIPRYYCSAINKALKNGYFYTLKVIEVLQNNLCNECIKVELTLYN